MAEHGAKHIARLLKRANSLCARINASPQQADLDDERAERKSLLWAIDELNRRATLPADRQEGRRLWLWKNFVDGLPEYWAFDNPFPTKDGGDPMTLGEPCGYAIFSSSTQGRTDVSEDEVIARIAALASRAKGA